MSQDNMVSRISQEERHKEILKDICSVNPNGRFYNNFVFGCEMFGISKKGDKYVSYGIRGGIIDMKRQVSQFIMSIDNPVLDICYHIKHGNIDIGVADQFNHWCWDLDRWDLDSATKILHMRSVKLSYRGVEIDLSLFNGNEVGLIRRYTERRIKQIELEREIKEKAEEEQKRKDLVSMFCSE